MSFEFIIFDLDDTLYPRGSGVMEEIRRRIQLWVCDQLDVGWEDATALRDAYLRQYGTTMRGLMVEHDVDVAQYLRFVHDIPIEDYLAPEPALAEMMAGIPLRKIVYTNATSQHARRVLRALGVADQFERIIGIEEVGLRTKRSREAYSRTLALLDADAQSCVMVEDTARNLVPAKALGMTTILIDAEEGRRPGHFPESCIDFAVDDVLQVGRVVDAILAGDDSRQDGSAAVSA